MPFVRHLGKTNMLTHIPEDIKLELTDGVLTLKAGSKVYVPNGFEADGTTPKFDEVVIESDLSTSSIGNATQNNDFLMLNVNNFTFQPMLQAYTFSGTTAPTSATYMIWYDTDNNLVKYSSNKGSTWQTGFSFPFALFSRVSGAISSLDQVFNGFGYIGSTVFALPNVKGLIPNGWNEDGTLRSIEFTVGKVLTQTRNISGTNAPLVLKGNEFANYVVADYNEELNLNISSAGGNIGRAIVGTWSANSSGVITSLTPKKVGEGVIKNKLYQLAAVKRSYWKYPFENNELPTLTENGTMGGDTFAVEASSITGEAYKAFETDKKDSWWISAAYDTSEQWFTFYNPKAFKLKKLVFNYGGSESYYYAKGIYIQGSNDNADWVNLYNYTATSKVSPITCKVNSDKAYKYHRIYIYDRAYYNTENCYALLNVTEIDGYIESTSSDYDYYTDKLLSYEPYAPAFERITKTFTASDALQTYIVPEGVASVKVTAVAGAGYSHTGEPGFGGRVICDLAVTSGQTLYIMAGKQPKSNSVTYNASDVRLDNTGITDTTSLQSRIIVAGGGGGQGSNSWAYDTFGGAGGGLTGAQGDSTYHGGTGGYGGTQTAGGAGGGGRSYTGASGTFGLGGRGGNGAPGAGGAGWYGGGGGGYSGYDSKHWVAGGGGGSSYTNPDLCTNVVHTQGANGGDGYVKIEYIKNLRS